jgi:hypothetical protein
MKITFIADFYVDEIIGGGELNNEELIRMLSERHEVKKLKSRNVTLDYIEKNKDRFYIISNFIHLNEDIKEQIKGTHYVIYEHDHKYIRSRNPALYENFIAPDEEIVNYEFYRHSLAILCQSRFHSDIVERNLKLDNIVNLGGNIWDDASLDKMMEHSKKQKSGKYSIMNSSIDHKNTRGSVVYCEYKNFQYEVINPSPYDQFLNNLSNNSKLIFLPKTPETLSRIVVEARMMNMGVVTNSKVGASSEPWFKLKGEELISEMRNKKQEILVTIEDIFKNA